MGRPFLVDGSIALATSERPKPASGPPADLLPILEAAGVVTERQLAEIRDKVRSGELPDAPAKLAERLVADKVLTEYQARRLLAGKSHGLLIGKYAILDRIGSGSMGRVFRAHHLLMGRVVALKVIAPEIAANAKAVARFQREMRLVARLDHPNVVRAFDADEANNFLYLVMEYVDGVSLGQRLKKGALPPIEVVNYAAQAALGLGHAHAQGIVHRDIKPSNLLLTQDKRVKVLDLGLGVLMEADDQATFATADGIAVGTIDYMSPEQACGREVDGRSDLYSLGCSMYHLMTGRQAFPGDSPIERLGKRIVGRPVPIRDVRPDLPASLVQVMDKLLANKPHDRFQTGEEAAEALNNLLRKVARKVAAPAEVPPSRVETTPAAPPEPIIVTVPPDYPRWFVPIADLAERNPRVALGVGLGSLTAAVVVGFAAAKMFG